MKRFLPILSIAVVMAACNTNADKIAATNPSAAVQPAPINNLDTAGFAEFQNYKAMNELAPMEEPVQKEQIAAAPVKKSAVTSGRRAPKNVASTPKRVSTSRGSGESNGSSGSTASTGNEGTGAGAGSGEVAQASEKKGWNKAAKGAVIGGVTGAAAGAVINKKNRAVGAVIGGVIGAGGGYVLGRGMDKKDGRYLTTGTYSN